MKAYADFSDTRLRGGCAYCNQPADTRDHIPAKAFLSKPYPANLHVVPSCKECNNALSKDEAYVAFLIDYLKDISLGHEQKAVEIASHHSEALEERIINNIIVDNGEPAIILEPERIKNVIEKFATAHVLYELGEKISDEPTHIAYAFVHQMTDAQIADFNKTIDSELYPEVGSRWMQRMVLSGNNWVVVQEDKYRYYIDSSDSIVVRIVIGELLYCELVWDN